MTKSPEFFSVTTMEATIGYVRDVVAMFRRRGMKTEFALPEVAGILGLTPKRAKSLFYRDGLWKMAEDEADRIKRKFADHLDDEIALAVEYTEQLRIKRDQLTMGLQCEYQSCSPHGSGYGSTGSLAA